MLCAGFMLLGHFDHAATYVRAACRQVRLKVIRNQPEASAIEVINSNFGEIADLTLAQHIAYILAPFLRSDFAHHSRGLGFHHSF